MEQDISDQLMKMVHAHPAWERLQTTFGVGLKRAPLNRPMLKKFLACHVASVRDVPTSILHTALRLSHECMKYDYFGGHAVAARTLVAAVHEYGLHDPANGIAKTHFELYRDAIHSWGFTEKEILDPSLVFEEAGELTHFNEDLAERAPIAKALGCHIAVEATADREFSLLWEGFAHHWQAYGLKGMEDPALGFYHIHIVQEPIHGDMSREALRRYLQLVPSAAPLAVEGATEYMTVYCKWVEAFNRTFFN